MNIPDFHRISKYYELPLPAEAMLANWDMDISTSIYSAQGKEKINEIADELTKLAKEYQLRDNFNDLLYLILTHDIQYKRRFTDLIEDNAKLKQRKEFAKLVLAINGVDSDVAVSFNIHSGKKKIKLDNPILSDIVKAVLKEGLTLNTTPFFHLGLDFLASIMNEQNINRPALIEFANCKIITAEALRNQLNTQLPLELCFSILPYLNGETVLAKVSNTNFSDRQLSFLFQVCKLLKYEPFSKKQFIANDYLASDYLRNALIKYVKKLKSKGNQTRYAFAI